MDDGLTTVGPIDSAYARHHVAEAMYHCARAEAAWAAKRSGATSAEMLMLADHFERAARDASLSLPPRAVERIATVRSVASLLSQTGMTRSLEIGIALSAIDKDVHGLATRLGPAPD